jgi:hypothetical protein
MFDCEPFHIDLDREFSEALEEVRTIAQKNDILIIGDQFRGTFDTGVVIGHYEQDDDGLLITITDRPFQEDCSHIQELLMDLFKANDERDYRKIFGYMNLKRL